MHVLLRTPAGVAMTYRSIAGGVYGDPSVNNNGAGFEVTQ
jgi:hypothetical protein